MSSASDAAERADFYAEAIRRITGISRQLGEWAQAYTDACIEQALTHSQGPWPRMPKEPANKAMVREVVFTAQDAATRRMWQQHRIVYDIDPFLWRELGETEDDTVIPAGLFTRLPHPDPFIAIPDPLVLPLDSHGQWLRVGGFFVNGRADSGTIDADGTMGYVQVSTVAPNANGRVGLLIRGTVETAEGKPVYVAPGARDMIFNRVTLDIAADQDTTVGQMIEQMLSRFDAYRGPGGGTSEIPEMVRACVSALAYICATNAELRPLPASTAKRRAKSRGAAKAPKVIQVGHLLGAKLRAYRRGEADANAAHTGGRKRPHIRRAHFHTYRTGPGRTESVIRWLSPIPINVDSEPKKNTVVTVPKSAKEDR